MRQLVLASCCVVSAASHDCGDITLFEDFAEWQDAVGNFTTLNFDEFGHGVHLTDEYNHLGVIFTDDFNVTQNAPKGYLDDGWGLVVPNLSSTFPIEVMFDEPQAWLAFLFPGFVEVRLFADDQIIDTLMLGAGGQGNFGGLISTIQFDRIEIFDGSDSVSIDDMMFGVPAPGAWVLLALSGLFGARRRQRSL